MIIATSVKALLITALAVVALWRLATPAAGLFALRASVVESELILTLTLPAFCLRVTTHLVEELADLHAFVWCDGCTLQSSERAWS